MKYHFSRSGQLFAGLAIAVLLTGCASGAAAPSTPTATAAGTNPATSQASASPAAIETDSITYGVASGNREPEKLDVYAPTRPGGWPVVVLFHGGGVSKGSYAVQALRVAAQGFVVFVPDWAPAGPGMPTPAAFAAFESVGACAVAFARSHAGEYGGDPDTMILFGHSAGANLAGGIAFTRPSPTPGCPGGGSLGPIHALVAWDGDWTLTDPSWDPELAADASSWGTYTPITHIALDRTLKVALLGSGVLGDNVRDLSDPSALAAFLSVRGPSGVLRGQLDAVGALDDRAYDIQEIQRVFYTLLKEQGNRVTVAELPDTSHDMFGAAMGDPALSVLVATIKEAADR